MESLDVGSSLPLISGGTIPRLGLGTWKSSGGEVGKAVEHALKVGYRHIDCAQIYGNEKEVGAALAEAFSTGLVSRHQLHITSKVFNNRHKERVHKAIDQTLHDLQLEYLDLYLVHWPAMFEDEEIVRPMRQEDGSPSPQIKISCEYLETWKEMEKLVEEGKVKAIGVSNFTKEQIEDIANNCTILPAVNQIEMHPLLIQQDLLDYCASKGIIITAYSPLGSGDSYTGAREDTPTLLKEEKVIQIAEDVGKTPAQVLLRWAIQKGVTVIPKSVRESRIEENSQIFDFELSSEQMQALDSLNRSYRFGLGWLPGHFL